MRTTLEFWPEYGAGPLWASDGQAVAISSLPMPAHLAAALASWNSEYDDSKLPFEENDEEWLRDGMALLSAVRAALAPEYDVVVTEPWWGELPSA